MCVTVGVAFLVSLYNVYLSIPFWIIAILVMNFFRDPERLSNAGTNVALSPADGKIIAVQESDVKGKFANYRKVSIFMNIFNVHVNRMPTPGKVIRIKHVPGKYLPADNPRASFSNERVELEFETQYGPVLVCLVAGLVARRISTYVFENQEVLRGERISIIKFGSRVDIYLPANARIEVAPGTLVRAGESPIATFIVEEDQV